MIKNISASQLSEELLNQLVNIWLKTNQEAHPFIAPAYWEGHEPEVKEQLPKATLLVSFEKEVVTGFLGVVDTYIAGLFIEKNYQGRGYGKQLLEAAKQEASTLTLAVYQKNKRAYDFYRKEGFTVVKEQIDEETNEREVILQWRK
ncbi:hypothetical protein IGI37_001919 [Enterococcus sp. AZ194]|uniref:GNAT family N-acetyltransferase n=1 Tax=Enterococcus sp. AZ194 TaxID=2774629 RepID=UPI003F23F73B